NQVGIDPVDEGYFLSLADRVRDGALPYRDFDTYYTPGIFYLYAWLLQTFGVGVGAVRAFTAIEWAACWLVLYRLARRLVSPWFAALPFLAVALVEPSPIWPAIHPGWLALLAALVSLEMVVVHSEREQSRWLVFAGAAAGVAFLFKQNVGAFATLGVAAYIVLRPGPPTGWLVRGLRIAFVSGLGLVVAGLLWPGLDAEVAVTLLLPVWVTLLLLVASSEDRVQGDSVVTPRRIATDAALAGGTFLLVGLLWLVPLTMALGVAHTPFGLFLGAVNFGALNEPLGPPPRGVFVLGLTAIWLPLLVVATIRKPVWQQWRWRLMAGTGASALVLIMPTTDVEMVQGVNSWPGVLDAELGWLYVYLPAVSVWAALAVHAGSRSRWTLRGQPLGWYLLFGTLGGLALYPRVDPLHAMMAGPPLLVVGAWALARVYDTLVGDARGVGRPVLFASLLVFPLAAAAPLVNARYASIVPADSSDRYVPLGLERAPVLVRPRTALEIGSTVAYIREHTAPGEPVFAYPMLPIVNFLADRPNPTRFSHFLPGALTPEDMAGVIASLEANPPRYVVWDHAGVIVWETDAANRPLSDYIWRCYSEVTSFGLVLVLERSSC
ncbi:MAG: glycosyltransferase family 39 protein, partial [Mycobacterium sp.]|nr:glycosyltransferase family 39 protein [Mycobacterium sp.]